VNEITGQTFMKTKLLLPVVIVVAIAALIFGYLEMSKEKAADAAADQPIRAASSVRHGTNGENIISFDLKTQQLIGLQTAPLTVATLPPEIKAYGRVLDPAPLATLASDIVSARAALDASGKEYDRLESLARGQNVSAKTLEDAGAARQHDQAALAAAEAQLAAATGNALANQPDLPAFVASLVKSETVLVRLDVPAGEWPGQTPVGALVLPPSGEQPIAAQFLDRAATTDPQVQGAGFLFVATNSSARLTPGLAVSGFLQMPGEPLHGEVVPDNAVVRSDERSWMYLQTADTDFVRREITLDYPVTGGWFVTNSVTSGDRVVVTGAQMLLSEERKSLVKLED
jgi:hypothetical protein